MTLFAINARWLVLPSKALPYPSPKLLLPSSGNSDEDCSPPRGLSGPHSFLVKAILPGLRPEFCFPETASHHFPLLKWRGLAKLDKQLPRAASCLGIVYCGSDWARDTRFPVPLGLQKNPSGCGQRPWLEQVWVKWSSGKFWTFVVSDLF